MAENDTGRRFWSLLLLNDVKCFDQMRIFRQMVLHFAEGNGGAGWGRRVAKNLMLQNSKICSFGKTFSGSCHMFLKGCWVTFDDDDASADKEEEKLVSKCICPGSSLLSSSRASLIFPRAPLYGAGTPLVWGANPFLPLFISSRPSHLMCRG